MNFVRKHENKLRDILFLFSIIVITKVIWLLIFSMRASNMLDFATYYEAVTRIMFGLNPYSKVGSYWFTYPATSLPYFAIFGFLPYFWSQIIWTVASLGSVLLSVILLLKLNVKKNTWYWIIVVFGLALLPFPMRFNLLMGQVNNFILLLLVLALYFDQKSNHKFSGLFWSVAILIKVLPIFLIFVFMRHNRRKTITVLFVTLFLGILASILLFGLKLNLDYLLTILPQSLGSLGKEVYYNQSLSGFVARLPYIPIRFKYDLYLISAGLFFFVYLLRLGKIKDFLLAFSFSITTLLLLNGYTFFHHLVLLVIPYVLLWPKISRKSIRIKGVYFLSYFLLIFNIVGFDKWTSPIQLLILSHDFYSLLLLFGLHFVV